MRRQSNGNSYNKIGVGTSLGVTFGFLLGMLLNNIIFILIGIASGSFYDNWKDKRKR